MPNKHDIFTEPESCVYFYKLLILSSLLHIHCFFRHIIGHIELVSLGGRKKTSGNFKAKHYMRLPLQNNQLV